MSFDLMAAVVVATIGVTAWWLYHEKLFPGDGWGVNLMAATLGGIALGSLPALAILFLLSLALGPV